MMIDRNAVQMLFNCIRLEQTTIGYYLKTHRITEQTAIGFSQNAIELLTANHHQFLTKRPRITE